MDSGSDGVNNPLLIANSSDGDKKDLVIFGIVMGSILGFCCLLTVVMTLRENYLRFIREREEDLQLPPSGGSDV
jgi:Na+/melibiose symporter-like transporter